AARAGARAGLGTGRSPRQRRLGAVGPAAPGDCRGRLAGARHAGRTARGPRLMHGPIALVGSGEYLPQMDSIDRLLLEHVGEGSARVVVLATAAGLEAPASPQRWSRMRVQHFALLGARAPP